MKVEKLLKAIIEFAKSDKLKVAANGLRALAFFLSLVNFEKFRPSNEIYCKTQIQQTVQNQMRNKSAKVCWNACIVVGKTIKNTSLASS